jgi:predicted deacylase
VELGPGRIVTELFIEAGVNGVLNTLFECGLLDGTPQPHPTLINAPYRMRRVTGCRTNTTGLVECLVKPGDAISKGQPLIHVRNIIGQRVETVHAEQEGYVLSMAEQSMCYPGTVLMTLAIEDD